VLAALLHDVGHYPYSHWIEEIGKFPHDITFPRHENRARDIIVGGPIGRLIERHWGIQPELVCDVIAERGLNNRTSLVNSFINSMVDVDKIDYLIRDAVHCGVDYGRGIDVERLLDSLYIAPSGSDSLCLDDKGRSMPLSILTCRNIMYQEVYWHKTVRACDSMFKRFFFEYVASRVDSVDEIRALLHLADDDFLKELHQRTGVMAKLQSLISPFVFGGRSLYKPAYVYAGARVADERADTRRFFEKVTRYGSYADLVEASKSLAQVLRADIADIDDLDIIVDKAPVKDKAEMYSMARVGIWNRRRSRWESQPPEVVNLNDYLHTTQQAYIYCHPRHYKALRRLSSEDWNSRLAATSR
jgi:uncharacterized protein